MHLLFGTSFLCCRFKPCANPCAMLLSTHTQLDIEHTCAALWDTCGGRVSVVLDFKQLIFLWKGRAPEMKWMQERKFTFRNPDGKYIALTYRSWHEACSELRLPPQPCMCNRLIADVDAERALCTDIDEPDEPRTATACQEDIRMAR